MTAVTFALKAALRQRLDVSPLTPTALAGMHVGQITSVALQYGNRTVPAGELFDVEPSTAGPDVTFRGGGDKLDFIGRGMVSGEILVEGAAGAYLGLQMKGGRIRVSGNAGIFCAAEMRGGQVAVAGDVGDWLGAALPGNRKGMAGGSVLVGGAAGARAGDHMRRGVVLIDGDAGDYLGSRMVAGTIVVRGRVGAHPGYAMKRGTLLLLSPVASLPPTFNDCGAHTLGFLSLLLKGLAALGASTFASPAASGRVRRYAGDLAVNGKGEILVVL